MVNNTQKTNAIKLLKEDHDKVKDDFKKFENLGDKAYVSKKKLAEEICQDLQLHMQIEEEIFYPAFRDEIKDSKSLINEAKVEHDSAKELIRQIQSMKAEEELFDAKVKVLAEYVNHHVEEEENDMFPLMHDSDVDLVALGKKLETRKQELS